jgi:choline dehydrogenase-like flavoprotein
VILCGGAINTPQLLQLSGVGDAALLAGTASTSCTTLPGVGENLQDHLEVYIQYASQAAGLDRPGLRWRRGPRSPTTGWSTAAASARPTTSRAAASAAATRTSTTRT